MAEFSVAFEIAGDDHARRQAFALYESALGARELAQFTPPGSDEENLHILMELAGCPVLLHPNKTPLRGGPVGCQFRFDSEDALRHAYALLCEGGSDCSMQSWPHAPVSALVTDRYGVRWWLHT